jgi:hypothetical protein
MKKLLNKLKVGLVLLGLLLGVLAVEAYLGYKYLYPNLSNQDIVIMSKNILRVDVESYQKTIDELKAYENYSPPALILLRENPFK